jgi:hypothetical protein
LEASLGFRPEAHDDGGGIIAWDGGQFTGHAGGTRCLYLWHHG